MRIATSIPDVLHICPGCDAALATGNLLCDGCRAKNGSWLEMVADGLIDPAGDLECPNLLADVREMQDELAPLLTLPGIAPELGAPIEPVAFHRDVISTPRTHGFVDLLWMLGASVFAAVVLGVLGVYQLFHDFRN